MCSGSEAGSYLRLIDFVYHSTPGLRVIKKKKKRRSLFGVEGFGIWGLWVCRSGIWDLTLVSFGIWGSWRLRTVPLFGTRDLFGKRTLNPTPYTLHPHPTPYTHTPHPTPYTLHFKP